MTTPRGTQPDPTRAADLTDFATLLNQLRGWAGNPSFRLLAKKVGPLLRPPRVMNHATLASAFLPGRRRLDLDLVVAVVRALGLDDGEVEKWRQSCIRVHASTKAGGSSGVFRQLPADLATFTGREAVMSELLKTATPPPGGRPTTPVLSAIEGMGGVGKTRLAVHAAHELVRRGHFGDLQLYVNLRGFDPEQAPSDPADVLDGFLRALEVPAERIPGGLEERATLFRDRMHDKRAIVLLDNAATADQVRPLIPAGPGCLVLITSRRSLLELDEAAPHRLDVFDLRESLELLARIAGAERVEADPAAAEAIVEFCGRLPMAVALLAAQLRARPAWDLCHLLGRVTSGRQDLLRTDKKNLRNVFDLSYQSLPEQARRLFRLLSLHPGHSFTAASAGALAHLPEAETDLLLEHLCTEYLLEQRRAGRYEFHDLLRRFAGDKCGEDEAAEDRDTARRRVMIWYLRAVDAANLAMGSAQAALSPDTVLDIADPPAFESYDEAMTWLDGDGDNAAAVTRAAFEIGWHDIAWRAPLALQRYFQVRARISPWVATLDVALLAAKALGDGVACARVLNCLGVAAIERRDHPAAVTWMEESVAAYRSFGTPLGLLSGLINLSVACTGAGQYAQAVIACDEAEVIARETGDTRRLGLALSNKAQAQQHSGDFQAAAVTNQQALDLNRRAGDRLGAAITLGSLGDVHRRLGDLPTALDCYREALTLRRALDHRRLQAASLLDIGTVLAAMGDHGAAAEAWTESLALFEETEDPRAETVRSLLAAPSRPA